MHSQPSNFPRYKVAIALLTYNNRDLLEQFLEPILNTTPTNGDYGIFVIDNASTDKTQEYLEQFSDRIHVIKVQKNQGFTNGYKVGLGQIDAEVYCMISSDVEVSPGWLEPVIALFDQDPKTAVVQPKIKSWHRRDEFEYAGAAGGYMDYQCYPFCRGRIFYTIEKDTGQYDDNQEVFWASGACFFIRAELYHSSGGLDDDFYAHMEEIDLCWRLKNQGYKIMVCPAAEVFHVGGAVIAYGSPQKVYRNHRNNLIMMMKNLPKKEVFWKIFLRLLMDGLAFLNMIGRGQVKASFSIVSAHWNFFMNLPKWSKKRRAVQEKVSAHTTTGIYPKSIVFSYFRNSNTKFSALEWPEQ